MLFYYEVGMRLDEKNASQKIRDHIGGWLLNLEIKDLLEKECFNRTSRKEHLYCISDRIKPSKEIITKNFGAYFAHLFEPYKIYRENCSIYQILDKRNPYYHEELNEEINELITSFGREEITKK
ncbi:MAG: hypothetical protein QW273_01770 [Candidatus Pacearchaeota archaeon]